MLPGQRSIAVQLRSRLLFMNYRLLVILFLFSLPVLLSRCAQVAQPPGGKKDSLAPVLLQSIPANRQLNYRGKTIELTFNEYINAENLVQKVLITPQDSNTFVPKIMPEGIRLTFNKPFQPNTTYTISFADAIRDITERNIAKNPKIVFSTGNSIDSLQISGTVEDAETRKPILGMVVGLFSPKDTLPIQRKRPQYFARTDSSGNYLLENVKSDLYQIYAFEDKDLNLVNNQPGERIAFRDSVIDLNKNLSNINLKAFKSYVKPRISRRERTDETVGLEFSSGMASYSVRYLKSISDTTVLASPSDTLVSFLERPTLIRLYKQPAKAATDTVHVLITTEDSTGNRNQFKERLYFSTLKSRAKDKVKLNADVTPKSGESVDKAVEINITFNKPVTRTDVSKILLYRTDSTKTQPLTAENLTWSNRSSRLRITRTTTLRDTMTLLIQKGAFFSIQDDTLARQKYVYRVLEADDYGLIAGRINRPEKNFIIELTDENYKVIRTAYNTQNYSFPKLKPGRYRLRLIIDSNGNRRRDTGNIQRLEQPEEIIYHPGMQDGIITLKRDFEFTDIDF